MLNEILYKAIVYNNILWYCLSAVSVLSLVAVRKTSDSENPLFHADLKMLIHL